LLGVGSTFVGTVEDAARMLQESPFDDEDATPEYRAAAIVDAFVADSRVIPGLGHPIHREADPRVSKLFAIAATHGVDGEHARVMMLIPELLESRVGKRLPINAAGAIGAIASDLAIPWQICRTLGLIARAAGLAGHLLEEMRQPMAKEIWRRADDEVSSKKGDRASRHGS
jgi:citrate synthase